MSVFLWMLAILYCCVSGGFVGIWNEGGGWMEIEGLCRIGGVLGGVGGGGGSSGFWSGIL